MRVFTQEEAVVSVGAEMLMLISWNFVANGFIFSCSSMFQALGNTWPTVISSGIRIALFVLPAIWVASRPGFQLREMWYVSIATMFIQMIISYWFVRREFAKRLGPA
jgi:Na+-driven multidrug efflux pump